MYRVIPIKDCMKENVISIQETSSIGMACSLLKTHHIGTLPVVNSQGRFIGLMQLRDLLALVMPDFIRLVEDIDFVNDFGAAETRQPSSDISKRRVREIMQPPISVEETCGLIRAYAVMNKENLHDLPVVDSKMSLVGIASRVDIGAALIAYWEESSDWRES